MPQFLKQRVFITISTFNNWCEKYTHHDFWERIHLIMQSDPLIRSGNSWRLQGLRNWQPSPSSAVAQVRFLDLTWFSFLMVPLFSPTIFSMDSLVFYPPSETNKQYDKKVLLLRPTFPGPTISVTLSLPKDVTVHIHNF